MAFHLKQNGMPMTIQAYITKMRAEEAGLKIKWKGDVKKARIQAGDDIRKVFGELFLFGAAAAIRMTEIESPSKP